MPSEDENIKQVFLKKKPKIRPIVNHQNLTNTGSSIITTISDRAR